MGEVRSVKDEKPKKVSYFRNMITNNGASSNREISASGAMGSISLVVGLLVFVVLTIFYIVNINEAPNVLMLIDKSIVVMTLGSSLLGVRKISSVIGSKKVDGASVDELLDALRKEQELQKKETEMTSEYVEH